MSKELRHENIIQWGKVLCTELLSPASIVASWHGQSLGCPRAESALVPQGCVRVSSLIMLVLVCVSFPKISCKAGFQHKG